MLGLLLLIRMLLLSLLLLLRLPGWSWLHRDLQVCLGKRPELPAMHLKYPAGSTSRYQNTASLLETEPPPYLVASGWLVVAGW